jgi:hypothetical protein
MNKRQTALIIASLVIAVVLSACGANATADWKVFAIEEEPAIDIQFRLPPEWYVDYHPEADRPGEWNIALVPPLCAKEQETEYQDNCVSLTVQIKEQADFDKDEFLALISTAISLNQTQTEETMLMSQTKTEVNGIEMQQFNHKVFIGEEEVLMQILFFETDSAYYYFIAEFPYEEREGATADRFHMMVESVEEIN